MKKIKLLLKRYPKLFKMATGFYFIFRKIQFKFSGTKIEEKYWANKKDDIWYSSKDGDWIKDTWDSYSNDHRKFLIEKICKYSPASVFEIGCNCGPNLKLLSQYLPEANIAGIDINAQSINKGNEWLSFEKISNVKLLTGKADDLQVFQNNSFDLVFTDALLMFIGPDKINKVIKEILRVTSKTIVLLEWHDFYSTDNAVGKYDFHWIRNYKTLFEKFIPEAQIKITKLPDGFWQDQNWQRYGAIIEIIK